VRTQHVEKLKLICGYSQQYLMLYRMLKKEDM